MSATPKQLSLLDTLTTNITGNAGSATTVVTNANLTGDVTSVGNATTIANNKVTFPMLNSTTTSDDITLSADSSVVLPTQHATKTYIDNSIYWLKFKINVKVASITNVNISSAPASIDWVALTAWDRVLLKNQTLGTENWVYVFSSTWSSLTRAIDSNTWPRMVSATYPVSEWITNQDTRFTITNDSITIWVTNIIFSQTWGAWTYVAWSWLQLIGNSFSIPTWWVLNTMIANPAVTSLSWTNTGDQTITLTWDATGSWTWSFPTTVSKVNGVAFSWLATGILKNTTWTWVPSIAVPADFPTLNQNTTGNAATATLASIVTTNANLTWPITSVGNATTITDNAVTNAKQADMANSTIKARITAWTWDPEDATVAQVKTLLNLAGSNTGDQTITLTWNVTWSGTWSFSTTIAPAVVTIPMLANWTAWQLVTWSAGWVATTVATWTAWQSLKSNWAGTVPTFQTTSVATETYATILATWAGAWVIRWVADGITAPANSVVVIQVYIGTNNTVVWVRNRGSALVRNIQADTESVLTFTATTNASREIEIFSSNASAIFRQISYFS